MTLSDIILIGLGAWRLASLLVQEDGPWDVFVRVRDWTGMPLGTGFFAKLLGCIWCTSVWTGTALYGVWLLVPVLSYLPAIWAVALIVDRWMLGWGTPPE